MSKRRGRKITHIPALSGEQLEKALAALGVVKMSKDGRAQLANMIKAASNPNAERIDVVIASLDEARKGNVQATVNALNLHTHSLLGRGRTRLAAMSDEAFDRLVEDANAEP